jgi:hypothetical protein
MLRLRSTWLAMLCLFCLLASLTRCAFSPPQYVRTEPRDAVIYVIAGGWHTELALPVSTISAPLATLEPGFGNARYLVFGWGARDYYMARDPDSRICCGRSFRDRQSSLSSRCKSRRRRLSALPTSLPSRYRGVARNAFRNSFGNTLAKDAEGVSQRVGTGPYPGSVFYASTGTFDLAHTCNTWTAEALQAAGLPVSSAGIVYAGQLLDQLRPFAVASPP